MLRSEIVALVAAMHVGSCARSSVAPSHESSNEPARVERGVATREPAVPEDLRARVSGDRAATHFRGEASDFGELIVPFGFEPGLHDPGQWVATTPTIIHLCPDPSPGEDDVLRSSCSVVGELEAGSVVWAARRFPTVPAAVLLLEAGLVFFDTERSREVGRARPNGSGWAIGPHRARWTFTPGGRLNITWGSGTCVSDAVLFDSRGRSLPCAGGGEMSPDARHGLDMDIEPCGIRGGSMRLIDLDTCRTSTTFELSVEESSHDRETTFDSSGVSVSLASGRTVRIPYPVD